MGELCTPSTLNGPDELQYGLWTENCVCCPLVSQTSDKPWDKNYIILLIFWSGWGKRASSGEIWTSFWVSVRLNGWVHVARAHEVALLFN